MTSGVSSLSKRLKKVLRRAKADGVTDDSAALQKAVHSHRTVFLPFGNYLIANTVTLKSDTVLLGEAYSMLLAGSSNADFAKNISDGAEPTPLSRKLPR